MFKKIFDRAKPQVKFWLKLVLYIVIGIELFLLFKTAIYNLPYHREIKNYLMNCSYLFFGLEARAFNRIFNKIPITILIVLAVVLKISYSFIPIKYKDYGQGI